MLQIKKRDGSIVSFNFTKILNRIKKAAKGLKVNSDQIFINVITSMPQDGFVTTTELDNLIASTAASYTGTHYDYSKLAANIAISAYHKVTSVSFADTVSRLVEDNIIHNDLFLIIEKYGEGKVEEMIDYERDYNFNYFAWKTLEQMYLIKTSDGIGIERPQHMYMRIALWITQSIEEAKEVYDLLSNQLVSCATPIMRSAGRTVSQLSSCVLKYNTGDSRTGLIDTFKDVAEYSADGAGIGLCMSNIRSEESRIATSGGYAGGLLKYIKIINENLRFFNQQGTRPGVAAVYIEPWHKDVFKLLEIKKNQGPEELRARDIFTALWIPDNFMRAVENNDDWYLFCPNDIKKAGLTALQEQYGEDYERTYNLAVQKGLGKKIKAHDLFYKIIESQIETGVPYMLFKDAVNRKTNHQNLGVIKQSNLCVAPETLLLTDNGYKEIQSLIGEKVNIWNGFEWSEVEPFKTNDFAELYTVKLSDGSILDCTDYHKWFVNVNYKNKIEVRTTLQLKAGDKLQKHDFPIILDGVDMKYPYTHGLLCADGHVENGNRFIRLYGEKKKLLSFLDTRNKYTGSLKNVELEKIGISYEDNNDRIKVSLPLDIDEKFFVPIDGNIDVKLKWLAGYLDGDGTVALNNQNGYFNQSIQVCSVNNSFILNVKLLLSTLGIKSNVKSCRDAGLRSLPNGKGEREFYDCNEVYRLTISSWYTHKLLNLGINFNRLKVNLALPDREAGRYVEVVEVLKTGRIDSTYCLNEPKNHSVIFNGVMTSNCAEIVQYTDELTTAICTLASQVIKNYIKDGKFDFNLLHYTTKVLTKILNRVIDVNHYSTDKGLKGGKEQRAIAIGVQGLADVFYMLDLTFTSQEARELNRAIFETIYHASIEGSMELVRDGLYDKYSGFEGSPMSKGVFQFDMWDSEQVVFSGMYDWDKLKKDVSTHGLANSLFVAQMPVASSAKVTDSYEMTEPMDSNLFNRRVLGGEFMIPNKYLVQDLEKLGIWSEAVKNEIIVNNGSIQEVNFLKYLNTDEKNLDKKAKRLEYLVEKYKTVWEFKQRDLIDLAADRAPFVDQTQSMNIYMANPTVTKITSSHLYSWKKGLKTGSYYMRTKAISTGAKHLAIAAAETAKQPSEYAIYVASPNSSFGRAEEPVLTDKPEGSPFDCEGCSA